MIYGIIESVCDRFKLSPFDVLQKPFDELIDIWEGAVISAHEQKGKNGSEPQGAKQEAVQVYSWNASWH